MEAAATIPSPHEDDDEDVHWALSTASALWARGERAEALKWLRRAAETASDANADTRALELFKAAAEVATRIATVPPPAGGAPSQAAPKTTLSPGGSQPPLGDGAQVLVAMAAPPPSSPPPVPGAGAPRVARRLPASAKQTATLASPVTPQGPASSPPMAPILIGVGSMETRSRATTPRPPPPPVPVAPGSSPGSSPPVSPPGGDLAAPPLVARAPRSGAPGVPPSTPSPGALGARPLGPRTEMAPTVPMPHITVTGVPSSHPGGVHTPDGPLVLRAPGTMADRKPPSSRSAARRVRPEFEIARVDDEVTIRKDAAAFGFKRDADVRADEVEDVAPPIDGKQRYDDLDEDTRVIPGRQQLGRILHAVEPASARVPSAPTPDGAVAGAPDVDDTPSGEGDPDAQGATSHDLARSVPGWPDASPTTLPALSPLPALRVAVLATAQAGEARIVPLVPGSVAPSGAVTAVLVPTSPEEGEALARLFLGPSG